MSDLISRQAVLDELEKWDWQDLYLPIHFKQILDDVPSADIMECAREIKDYCEGFPNCEGCRFYKGLPFRCVFVSCPQGWDLHEGEKK